MSTTDSAPSPKISNPRSRTAALSLYDTLTAPLDGMLEHAQTEARKEKNTHIADLLLQFIEPKPTLTPSDILLSYTDPASPASRETTKTLQRWRELTRDNDLVTFFTSRKAKACLKLKDILAESLEMSLHPNPDDPRLVFTLQDIATILESLPIPDQACVGYEFVADVPSWKIGNEVLAYIDETMKETMLDAARRQGIDISKNVDTIRTQLLGDTAWRSVGDKLRSLAECGALLGDTSYVEAVATRLDEIRQRMAAEMEERLQKKRDYQSTSGQA